jgi:sugar transferase EpsL
LLDTRIRNAGQNHPALGGAKRATDMVVSSLLLLILMPLLLFIALLVLVAMGRPVFFTQQRSGLGGRPFQVIKFRSMSDQRDSSGTALPDSERLRKVGRFLRSTSLDELPELINVLRGDMSLVGPRPLMFEYVPLYSPEQFRRHDVRPGLTGLAQVSGRNALSWEEKFALDVRYVDQWSMGLDLKILAATAWRVLTRQGISDEGHATAPKFQGDRTHR